MAKKAEDGVKKVDMVRDAIANLGWKAKVGQYVEYIKEKYGIEMTKGHISQTKSSEKRKGKGKGRRGRKPAAVTGGESSGAKISDIITFISEIQTWKGKIGTAAVRDVVKTVLK